MLQQASQLGAGNPVFPTCGTTPSQPQPLALWRPDASLLKPTQLASLTYLLPWPMLHVQL